MKLAVSAFFAASLLFSVTPAFANADDDAWIKQCVEDNDDQKQADGTVAVYCACMNEKMSSGETKTVTEWEKLNPAENDECSARAGWK